MTLGISKEDVISLLEDYKMNKITLENVKTNYQAPATQAIIIKFLRQKRIDLLDKIHLQQQNLDKLDYVIYNVKKNAQSKNC